MSEMTYTRCDLCEGSLVLTTSTARFNEADALIEFSERKPSPCFCTESDTPGWTPTGLTIGQIDRMVERERVLKGDPGVPADRASRIIAEMRSALEKT